MKLQASVGNTTYTIEDQPEFFVPAGLVVEYVVARITPRIGRVLMKIANGDADG